MDGLIFAFPLALLVVFMHLCSSGVVDRWVDVYAIREVWCGSRRHSDFWRGPVVGLNKTWVIRRTVFRYSL